MPLCPYCHTVVGEDNRFCPECGRPLAVGPIVKGGSKSKKKPAGIIAACTIATIAAIVLISVKPWVPTHTLSVTVSPLGAGSVSPSSGKYKSGAQLTLTASSVSGYYFDDWSGSASGTTTNIAVIMDSDKSITANFATTPQPKFTTPGTGAAVGWVMFPDYTPAYRSVVYIFKQGETSSFAARYVDTNGYYLFDNLPVGSYEIYTASTASLWLFTGSPAATITVSEYETSSVPNLTVLRNIEIALDNPKIATMPGENYTRQYIIDGHNPKFTWNSVPNAVYYVVEIWSTSTKSHPSNRDYDESQQVVSNMIVWPTSLSSTPYQEFRIDVEAHMEGGTQIASGSEWFTIDNPPSGWVYK
jgi:hypothetical protein